MQLTIYTIRHKFKLFSSYLALQQVNLSNRCLSKQHDTVPVLYSMFRAQTT